MVRRRERLEEFVGYIHTGRVKSGRETGKVEDVLKNVALTVKQRLLRRQCLQASVRCSAVGLELVKFRLFRTHTLILNI